MYMGFCINVAISGIPPPPSPPMRSASPPIPPAPAPDVPVALPRSLGFGELAEDVDVPVTRASEFVNPVFRLAFVGSNSSPARYADAASV